MQIKDYYKTLGVTADASLQEIKGAYRQLMHRYHPDKNTNDQYTAGYFHEIREAYEILSQPKLRAAYDNERYLSGLSGKKNVQKITPAFIYNEAVKLLNQTTLVDAYKPTQSTVFDQADKILSDHHLAILQRESDAEFNQKLVGILLEALKGVDYFYFKDLCERLILVSRPQEVLIQSELQKKKQMMQWLRIKPWAIIFVSVFICLCMFLFLRQLK